MALLTVFLRWRETAKERAASGGAETASIRWYILYICIYIVYIIVYQVIVYCIYRLLLHFRAPLPLYIVPPRDNHPIHPSKMAFYFQFLFPSPWFSDIQCFLPQERLKRWVQNSRKGSCCSSGWTGLSSHPPALLLKKSTTLTFGKIHQPYFRKNPPTLL